MDDRDGWRERVEESCAINRTLLLLLLLVVVVVVEVVVIIICEGLYFDLAQGQMNGAPNETRTHSCRFASLTC